MTADILGLEYACLLVILGHALCYGWICLLGTVDLSVLFFPEETCILNFPYAMIVLYMHSLQVMFTSVGCSGMATPVFPGFPAQQLVA